ncbi:DNA primase [bacterium]|nr:DNA primase [bacterium]
MANLNEAVDAVLGNINIVSVISRYLTLRKGGKNHMGLCPFHSDSKSPSLSVSEDKGLYHCFGCGASGNVITFISEIEGISRFEAIKALANEIGIDITSGYQKGKREKFLQITQLAAKTFHNNLINEIKLNPTLRKFIKDRHITENIAKQFFLGYAPFDADRYVDELKLLGKDVDVAKDLGVIAISRAGRPYFKMHDRFIFPITDINGYPIGFGGRTLSKDETIPKYINSQNSPIYNKSKSLYGLGLAKDYIKVEGNAILVEGYFDMMTLFKAGIRNVVSSSGTALTPEQVLMLKRLTDKILVFYDSDDAGQKAAFRSIEILLSSNIEGKIFKLPVKDPDQFINERGAEEFKEVLNKEGILLEDFYLFYLSRVYDLSVKKQKQEAYSKALDLLRVIADNDIKEKFLGKIADFFQYSNIFVEEDYQKGTLRVKAAKPEKVSRKINLDSLGKKYHEAADNFFQILFRHAARYEEDVLKIDLNNFPVGDFRELLASLLDYLDMNGKFESNGFISFLADNEKEELVSSAVTYIMSNEEGAQEEEEQKDDTSHFHLYRLQMELFGIRINVNNIKKVMTSPMESKKAKMMHFKDMSTLNNRIVDIQKELGGYLHGK